MAFTYPHKPGAESRSVAQLYYDSTSLMVCLAFFMTTRHKKITEKGAKRANSRFSLAQLLKKDFKPFIETFIYTAEWCPCIALGTM